ncbi:MAG: Asp23/Gls24 family envelope stress response protein [Eubacteriaceae bacterium]|nr:Asp23/Gls24 family envelope stress response protein [Eubacteriaceae bacterium]
MADNSVTTTEYGKITVTRHAVGLVVLEAVKKQRKKVHISNHKGRITGLMGRISGMDDIDNIDITFDEKGVPSIKFFVIIRFGSSITRTTNSLIEDIHNGVRTFLGVEPDSISVVVAGMISKNIAKRNIEVSRRYDCK